MLSVIGVSSIEILADSEKEIENIVDRNNRLHTRRSLGICLGRIKTSTNLSANSALRTILHLNVSHKNSTKMFGNELHYDIGQYGKYTIKVIIIIVIIIIISTTHLSIYVVKFHAYSNQLIRKHSMNYPRIR